jgi:hypothetical protein
VRPGPPADWFDRSPSPRVIGADHLPDVAHLFRVYLWTDKPKRLACTV